MSKAIKKQSQNEATDIPKQSHYDPKKATPTPSQERSQNDTKSIPKRPQNESQNRPIIGLLASLAPQKGPRGSKRASETELG